MLIWRWVSALDQELCAKTLNKSGDITGTKRTEEGSRKFLGGRRDKGGATAKRGAKIKQRKSQGNHLSGESFKLKTLKEPMASVAI